MWRTGTNQYFAFFYTTHVNDDRTDDHRTNDYSTINYTTNYDRTDNHYTNDGNSAVRWHTADNLEYRPR